MLSFYSIPFLDPPPPTTTLPLPYPSLPLYPTSYLVTHAYLLVSTYDYRHVYIQEEGSSHTLLVTHDEGWGKYREYSVILKAEEEEEEEEGKEEG